MSLIRKSKSGLNQVNHLEEGRTSLLVKVEFLQEQEEETSQRMRQLQEESKLREQSLLTRIAELETQTVSIHQTDSTQESHVFFGGFFLSFFKDYILEFPKYSLNTLLFFLLNVKLKINV